MAKPNSSSFVNTAGPTCWCKRMSVCLYCSTQYVRNPSNESEPVEPHLDIELLELLQVEPAAGTVLQESLVPLLQLVFIKLRVLHQILHHFRGQLAVLFPHFSCKAGTVHSIFKWLRTTNKHLSAWGSAVEVWRVFSEEWFIEAETREFVRTVKTLTAGPSKNKLWNKWTEVAGISTVLFLPLR